MTQPIIANGIQTHFVRFMAPKKSADFFVMLHGWGGSTKSFEILGPKLAQALNQNIIIPDLPGFGDSDFPSAEGWTTHDYELWLEEFLDQTIDKKSAKKITLYGHSFGCRIILRFLLKHPEWKDKVILTGAAGLKVPLSTKQRLRKLLAATNVQSFFPKKIRRFFSGNSDWHQASDILKKTLKKVFAEEDLAPNLKDIQTQTLLLWGANDTYTPLSSGKKFAKNLPNNHFIVFKDGRHGIHYTHADQITKAITKFLK